MKSRFRNQFNDVFMKIMGTATVDESWAMNSIAEWDSLKHIQLIAELEDELSIQFEYEDIVTMNSIEKIDEVLCKY
jgi:acyl carrier protein